MTAIPELRTERLLMRAWRESDLDDYAAMAADPAVMRYIGQGKPADRADAWRAMALFVGHWALRGFGLWAVERQESGSFIGRVGLWQPEGWPGLEVGWALARSHWGHGYATEAGRASIQFAWDVVGVDEVISLIEPENSASQRVAERLGMHVRERHSLAATEVLVYQRSRAQGDRRA
ncbi:MAG TPA: GNAT family N-acetyltransferase [Solirubrobacteraceae bacterium]